MQQKILLKIYWICKYVGKFEINFYEIFTNLLFAGREKVKQKLKLRKLGRN